MTTNIFLFGYNSIYSNVIQYINGQVWTRQEIKGKVDFEIESIVKADLWRINKGQ